MKIRVKAYTPIERLGTLVATVQGSRESVTTFVANLQGDLSHVALNPTHGKKYILPSEVARNTVFEITLLEGDNE